MVRIKLALNGHWRTLFPSLTSLSAKNSIGISRIYRFGNCQCLEAIFLEQAKENPR